MTEDLLRDLLLAIEQQLDSPQTPYVRQALVRLLGLGVPEAEAKTRIALCLAEEMDNILRDRRLFDEKAYRAALGDLQFGDDEEE